MNYRNNLISLILWFVIFASSAGCVRTKIVTEYVHVPSVIEVPVVVTDTLAFTIYRDYVGLYDSHVNWFDVMPDSSDASFIQAANAEGRYLRSWATAVREFFLTEIQRFD